MDTRHKVFLQELKDWTWVSSSSHSSAAGGTMIGLKKSFIESSDSMQEFIVSDGWAHGVSLLKGTFLFAL